jgi:predicted  nucleic acid-binding Zn-ribbon protein
MANTDDRDTPCEERLEATKVEINELRENNEQLLKSSNDFGQLAERLNTELQQERRRGQPDRRRWPRIGAVSRRASQAP